MTQEIIDGFIEEMVKKGFSCHKCDECGGALWVEGEKELMLMRYSSVMDGECMDCMRMKKRVGVVE